MKIEADPRGQVCSRPAEQSCSWSDLQKRCSEKKKLRQFRVFGPMERRLIQLREKLGDE